MMPRQKQSSKWLYNSCQMAVCIMCCEPQYQQGKGLLVANAANANTTTQTTVALLNNKTGVNG
jgi:hypothetical protein